MFSIRVTCYTTTLIIKDQLKYTYIVSLFTHFLTSEMCQSVEFLEDDKLQSCADTQFFNLSSKFDTFNMPNQQVCSCHNKLKYQVEFTEIKRPVCYYPMQLPSMSFILSPFNHLIHAAPLVIMELLSTCFFPGICL